MANISQQIYRVKKRRTEKNPTSRKVQKEKRTLPQGVSEEVNMNEDTKLISFAVTNGQYEMLKERANELGIKTQDLIEFLIEPFTIALEEMTNDEKREELTFKEHLLYLAEKRKKAMYERAKIHNSKP